MLFLGDDLCVSGLCVGPGCSLPRTLGLDSKPAAASLLSARLLRASAFAPAKGRVTRTPCGGAWVRMTHAMLGTQGHATGAWGITGPHALLACGILHTAADRLMAREQEWPKVRGAHSPGGLAGQGLWEALPNAGCGLFHCKMSQPASSTCGVSQESLCPERTPQGADPIDGTGCHLLSEGRTLCTPDPMGPEGNAPSEPTTWAKCKENSRHCLSGTFYKLLTHVPHTVKVTKALEGSQQEEPRDTEGVCHGQKEGVWRKLRRSQ